MAGGFKNVPKAQQMGMFISGLEIKTGKVRFCHTLPPLIGSSSYVISTKGQSETEKKSACLGKRGAKQSQGMLLDVVLGFVIYRDMYSMQAM